MKKLFYLLLIIAIGNIYSQSIQSPSKQISLDFKLANNGVPTYAVTYNNKGVIAESALGIKLKGGINLSSDFIVENSKTRSFNETWHPVLGEQSNIVNNYNELTVSLFQAKSKIKMNLIFRIFDEGVAFRYDFPKQPSLNYFIISDEVSEFNLTGNHKVFWIPGDFDSNEYAYNETLFSNIDTEKLI